MEDCRVSCRSSKILRASQLHRAWRRSRNQPSAFPRLTHSDSDAAPTTRALELERSDLSRAERALGHCVGARSALDPYDAAIFARVANPADRARNVAAADGVPSPRGRRRRRRARHFIPSGVLAVQLRRRRVRAIAQRAHAPPHGLVAAVSAAIDTGSHACNRLRGSHCTKTRAISGWRAISVHG